RVLGRAPAVLVVDFRGHHAVPTRPRAAVCLARAAVLGAASAQCPIAARAGRDALAAVTRPVRAVVAAQDAVLTAAVSALVAIVSVLAAVFAAVVAARARRRPHDQSRLCLP